MSKTFTQEELNKVVNDRLAKEQKKYADLQEKTNAKLGSLGYENFDQVKTLASERDTYKQELDELKKQTELNEKRSTIQKLGVDKDFVDFVLEKAPEGNYADFVDKNPKFKAENFTKGGSNPNYNGQGIKKPEEAESDAEYLRLRREQDNK